jgi:hypothetical protein
MAATTLAKKPASSISLIERKRLCEAWQKTNLSRSEFIRRNGLPDSFHSWCTKLLSSTNPKKIMNTATGIKTDEKWMQIIPSNVSNDYQPHIQTSQRSTEFKLICNDINLSFCMPMDQIINFVRGLCHAATVIR